jgi:hypothetical protein
VVRRPALVRGRVFSRVKLPKSIVRPGGRAGGSLKTG